VVKLESFIKGELAWITMALKLFHQSFGFTKSGVSAKALIAPEITNPHIEKKRYRFLKNAYQGATVFSEPRLFLNMNPAQILGVRIGYTLAVNDGDKYVLDLKSPSNLYINLLARARKPYESELDQVEDVALGRGVNPFERSDSSLIERLNAVTAGSPDISEKFNESLPGMELSVRNKSTDVYDPNCDARTKGSSNRRLYAKPIVDGLQQLYTKFCVMSLFPAEMDKAEQAARK
jgi:hypothetical protein